MTYRIVRNTRQNVLILATASNTAIVVSGNNTDSAFGLPSETANIAGVHIKQIWSSSDSGAGSSAWTVARGANTVWQMESTAWHDFAGNGCTITLDQDATLSLTKTGTIGTIMLELQKIYLNGSEVGSSDY